MTRQGALTTVVLFGWALTSCATPPPSQVAALKGAMHRNFSAALDLRTAALQGDLGLIRESGDTLLRVLSAPEVQEQHQASFDAVREAASQAAEAATLGEGAAAAAEVARRCGTCHQQAGAPVGEMFVVGGVSSRDNLRGHMDRLAWANRLLWDGLVGPSDRTWTAGVEALESSPAFPQELERFEMPATVDAVQASFDRAVEQVRDAEAWGERGRALGAFWTSCGGCHRLNELGR